MDKAITQARIDILLENPFFGHLILRLRLIENPNMPTLATDGKHLFYNPAYLKKKSRKEIAGLLCHEVLHNALGHLWRRNERNSVVWNIAGDYAVNLIVRDTPNLELPDDCLYDASYRGWATEKIYAHLIQNAKTISANSICLNGKEHEPDCHIQEPQDTEKGNTEQDWTVVLNQALKIAKSAGKLPASLEELVKEVLRPKVDWKSALRKFLNQNTPTDYTWTIPNRKFLASGFYMPTVNVKSIPCVVVAVDTSGSISHEELVRFKSEIIGIRQETNIETLYVVYCDAEVNHVEELGRGSEFEFKVRGRGGTSFVPVFTWIEENDINPACLIYLTDTEGDFPSAPQYPVLWAVTCLNAKVPFGDTLYVGDND